MDYGAGVAQAAGPVAIAFPLSRPGGPRYLSLLFCLVVFGLGGLALGAAERPIRIGVENNSPPLSFVDQAGQPVGFSAELLNEMQREGDLRLAVVPNYWSFILADFEAGRLDALANVTITEERRTYMDFSIAHAYVHGLVYYRKDRPALRRTADFAGKTIATLMGSIGHTNAITHRGWGATIRPYRTWQEALDATFRGECDGALFIRSPGSSPNINDHGMRSDFVDDIVHEFHMAVHKGDSETLAKLNEALAVVRHNGAFDRIYSKWIGPLEPHPIRLADLRPYYLPVSLGLLAVGTLIWWQRRMLARQARQAAALRASEERWKFALEGSGDGVWDWDARTGRVLRSRRWKEMLGYAEDEIGATLGEWVDRIHPDDRAATIAAQQAHHEGRATTFAIEHRMRCKDGSWKWILNRGMIVERDAQGQPRRIIGTHTDLTASKQSEADRLILGKLESTGVLAGGIAHDFNNLLTAILLNLELARFSRNSPAELMQRVEAAEKAAQAARSLTQQLITFAQGGVSVVRKTDLTTLLRESTQLALSGSAVRSELEFAPGLWHAEVDEGQIGQVIRNLVLNAREAMPKGGVITVRAENVVLRAGEVAALPAGDYLRVSVVDQGDGIAPEVLSKIFDPYFSTKRRGTQKGMGLGLTICHSVIQKHGGVITVESVPGRGTTFHVHLAAHRQPGPAADTPAAGPATALRAGHLLVMDDEAIIRETIGQTLEKLGHHVTLTAEGQAAVALFAKAQAEGRPFDAVLLDLTIPGGMGGLETLHAMQALDPGVKAIVMSGYTNDKVMHGYAAAGFKAALSKPFNSEALREALAPVLGK